VISSVGRRRLVVLTLIVAFAAGTAGAAISDSGSGADVGKTATFRDAVGEEGPDIETVVVSIDGRGHLSFRIDIPSYPSITDDMRIRVWLDTDVDVTTGLGVEGVRGADYFILLDRWELGLGEVALFTCSGSMCSGGKALPTSLGTPLRFSYRDGATFTVDPADLGMQSVERVRFSIEAWTGIGFDPIARRYDFTNASSDFAPDGAGRWLGYPSAQGEDFWTYEASAVFVKSFSAQPAKPRAGRQFSLRLALIGADTKAPFASGFVSCSMKVAGQPLRPSTRGFVGTRAVCTYSIPPDARGRTFESTISVSAAGEKVVRSLSGRVLAAR
jgi:hypothetical protein